MDGFETYIRYVLLRCVDDNVVYVYSHEFIATERKVQLTRKAKGNIGRIRTRESRLKGQELTIARKVICLSASIRPDPTVIISRIDQELEATELKANHIRDLVPCRLHTREGRTIEVDLAPRV